MKETTKFKKILEKQLGKIETKNETLSLLGTKGINVLFSLSKLLSEIPLAEDEIVEVFKTTKLKKELEILLNMINYKGNDFFNVLNKAHDKINIKLLENLNNLSKEKELLHKKNTNKIDSDFELLKELIVLDIPASDSIRKELEKIGLDQTELERMKFDFDKNETPSSVKMKEVNKRLEEADINKNLSLSQLVNIITLKNDNPSIENEKNNIINLFNRILDSEAAEINGWLITAINNDLDGIKDVINKSKGQYEKYKKQNPNLTLDTFIIADVLEHINSNSLQMNFSSEKTSFVEPFEIDSETKKIKFSIAGAGTPDIIYNIEDTNILDVLNVSANSDKNKDYNLVTHSFKMLILQKLIDKESIKTGKPFSEIFKGLKENPESDFSKSMISSLDMNKKQLYKVLLQAYKDNNDLDFLTNDKLKFGMLLSGSSISVFNSHKNLKDFQEENYDELKSIENVNSLILQYSQLDNTANEIIRYAKLNGTSGLEKEVVYEDLKSVIENQFVSLLSNSGEYSEISLSEIENFTIESFILNNIASEKFQEFNKYNDTNFHNPDSLPLGLENFIIKALELMSQNNPKEFLEIVYDLEKKPEGFNLDFVNSLSNQNLQSMISNAINSFEDLGELMASVQYDDLSEKEINEKTKLIEVIGFVGMANNDRFKPEGLNEIIIDQDKDGIKKDVIDLEF